MKIVKSTLFFRLRKMTDVESIISDNAVVSIEEIAGKLYTTGETPFLHELDVNTLNTSSRVGTDRLQGGYRQTAGWVQTDSRVGTDGLQGGYRQTAGWVRTGWVQTDSRVGTDRVGTDRQQDGYRQTAGWVQTEWVQTEGHSCSFYVVFLRDNQQFLIIWHGCRAVTFAYIFFECVYIF